MTPRLLAASLLTAAACGSDSSSAPDAAPPAIDAAPVLVTEKPLTIAPTLAGATLTIVATDGATPVLTDLWLYTLDGAAQTPLTAFTSTAARKSPRLVLPATIGGAPSGLSPADDGAENGLMTNTKRGRLDHGTFVSTIDGTVTVTLAAAPTLPILIVAGREDQRYAGAAVIAPDGTAGTVPSGVGAVETHVQRSYARDVDPILHGVDFANCSHCHDDAAMHPLAAMYKEKTRDDLVGNNFAFAEGEADCHAENPAGGPALDDCIAAITEAEYFAEPGAPAISPMTLRARPDESKGSSATGLVWFGSHGVRWNAEYGDRRMPSTTESTEMADWLDIPTYFDEHPGDYQILWDWVAQGCPE